MLKRNEDFLPRFDRDREPDATVADVCLIVEGCYPYVSGGVSSWTHDLIRQQSHLEFSVVSILAQAGNQKAKYQLGPNVASLDHLYLHQRHGIDRRPATPGEVEQLVDILLTLVEGGGALADFSRLIARVNDPRRPLGLARLMNSTLAWEVIRQMYLRTMPYASFLHYYWAWRALFGGLFATVKFPLPRARVYHTASTGYAGLLAARASLETGRPAIITEHGIYTNERRAEVLMANWIADTLDTGFSLSDERYDLRGMWMRAFESQARVCYQACSEIVTLHTENQKMQTALGADRRRMRLIPNGVRIERFDNIPRPDAKAPPTIALIGRVVPIKDIKTFILAANALRAEFPDLRALIVGPTDEDPAYHRECKRLVRKLKLEDCVDFTGMVRIEDYLPKIHINVLTSVSEAQPLVVLEAGAAGIPCVATDVGSCREIIEGRKDEDPALGAGGIVTGLVAPEETAAAVAQLLRDRARLDGCGRALRQRVRRHYRLDQVAAAYRDIYDIYRQAPDEAPSGSSKPSWPASDLNYRS